MSAEYTAIEWDATTIDDCRQIVRLAIREDLRQSFDLTTTSLVAAGQVGQARIAARQAGVVCGLRAAGIVLDEADAELSLEAFLEDGQAVEAGTAIGQLSGNARDMLTMERILLNMIGRLSGIATRTSKFVEAAAGTPVRIYDTRKTTPGWRRMEKYAVRCGGGFNHREGLFDAVLIKDNHLALSGSSVAAAVQRARESVSQLSASSSDATTHVVLEVEVDSLEQLQDALTAKPDVVLLDNMSSDQHREAVRIRDKQAPATQLEASGGIDMTTVRAIAEAGVDRISIGGLTHSAVNFDVGLDWQ